MLTHRAWLLFVVAGAFALAHVEHATAAEVTTVAQLERLSPVTAWEDTVVWSAYDADIDAYRLTALHDGTVRTLPVDPVAIPFDADVGPDSSGNAAIVYSRCEDPDQRERQRGDCDVYIYSLRSGEERPIRNVNSDASEFEPTLWRGEVAWARTYGGQPSRPFVYRRPLVAPRVRRSERLPSVPTRNCNQDLLGNDCATIDRHVEDLELYGRWLALSAQYNYEETAYDSPVTELRLSDLRGARTKSVDLGTSIGGDASSFTFAGLTGGHLIWHSSGVSGGKYSPMTSYSSTPRLRLSTGRREVLRTNEGDQPRLAGLAATPSTLYRVTFDLKAGYTFDDIAVQRLDELRWERP